MDLLPLHWINNLLKEPTKDDRFFRIKSSVNSIFVPWYVVGKEELSGCTQLFDCLHPRCLRVVDYDTAKHPSLIRRRTSMLAYTSPKRTWPKQYKLVFLSHMVPLTTRKIQQQSFTWQLYSPPCSWLWIPSAWHTSLIMSNRHCRFLQCLKGLLLLLGPHRS